MQEVFLVHSVFPNLMETESNGETAYVYDARKHMIDASQKQARARQKLV